MNIHDVEDYWYPLDATFGFRGSPDGSGIPKNGASFLGDGWLVDSDWCEEGDNNTFGWIGNTDEWGDGMGRGDTPFIDQIPLIDHDGDGTGASHDEQ
jgi:hypothetical protein